VKDRLESLTDQASMARRTYYVYIMANADRTIYVGVTNNLVRRVGEHRDGLVPGFTKTYRLTSLVYFESFDQISSAIAWEKVVKGWRRSRKLALIEESNPGWIDLWTSIVL
jgi:putative endonuclease